jgi:hypothetical protein
VENVDNLGRRVLRGPEWPVKLWRAAAIRTPVAHRGVYAGYMVQTLRSELRDRGVRECLSAGD